MFRRRPKLERDGGKIILFFITDRHSKSKAITLNQNRIITYATRIPHVERQEENIATTTLQACERVCSQVIEEKVFLPRVSRFLSIY